MSVNNLEFSSQKPTLGYLANIPSLSDLKITNSNLNMDITNIFTTNNLTSITLDSCDFYANGYEFEELYYLDLRGSGVVSAPTTNDQCYVEY